MSKLTGDQVYTNLMDLDLLLQDGDQMVQLKLFLGSVPAGNAALCQLNEEILGLTKRLTDILQAIQ